MLGVLLATAAAAVHAASPNNDAEVRKVTRDYASCVVKKHGDRASEAIMTDSGNGDIQRRYSDLIDSACLSSVAGSVQLKFGGDHFRYALADALVNTRIANDPVTSFADRLPLAHIAKPDNAALEASLATAHGKAQREELQKTYDRQLATSWLSRYGECVVRQEPTKARYWLLTPPDSPEEISRINDLRPAFADCLAEGTMKFNRTTMRGAVAINYYRLAMATRVPGSVQ
jgi:hypothetical protein